jgi:hypothetical protein
MSKSVKQFYFLFFPTLCSNVGGFLIFIHALRRPYTNATIGNMLPATFYSNVAGSMLPIVALV